jgi:hypothetical protein
MCSIVLEFKRRFMCSIVNWGFLVLVKGLLYFLTITCMGQ